MLKRYSQEKETINTTLISNKPSMRDNAFKAIVILLIFTQISPSTSAQWLKDFNNNNYNPLTVQYWKATEIEELTTYYYDEGKEEIKTETTFSVDRRQISQTLYKEDIRIASFVYQFNPWKLLLTKTIRELQTDGTWKYIKQQYTYQEKLLRSIACFDVSNNPIYFVLIENDSLGLPVKAVQLSTDSVLIASEKAIVDYSTKRINYFYYNSQGSQTNTEQAKIGYKKAGFEKVNLHGDCYFYPKNGSPNDTIYCSVDIKYDSNGNWISKKIYEGAVTKSWELSNPKLVCAIKRKIKYVN